MKRLLLILVPLVAASCGPAGGGAPGGGGGGGGKWGGKKDNAPAEAVPVRVEKVGRGFIALKLLTTSTVDPVRRVELVSKASGVVKELFVAEGATVEAQAKIAQLDDDELALALKKAEVNAAKAKADFEHTETLLKEKFVSVDEFRKVEQAWKTAELEVETARLALANATLLAPIAGTLTRLDLQKGRYANANAAIGEITDLAELECVIFVPERDLLRLAQDQPAEVASESLKASFKARVKRVNPVIDRASGTAKAWLALEDPERKLRPGMFVDVSIVLDPRPNALLVPKKALVFDEGRPGVFVKKGDAAKWCELTLGFQEKDAAEVLKGVEEGEEVVVVGQNGLKDGSKVRVVKEENP